MTMEIRQTMAFECPTCGTLYEVMADAAECHPDPEHTRIETVYVGEGMDERGMARCSCGWTGRTHYQSEEMMHTSMTEDWERHLKAVGK